MTIQADQIRDRRRAFAAPGGFHDKLVRFLATALPAGVGVIVAIMVLSPLSPHGEISFLLDRNKVAMVRERLRMDNATYRGEDSDGRAFTVSAGSAVQQTAKVPVVEMRDLVAAIQMSDGPARLAAPQGNYNFDSDQVAVSGPVTFSAADGYAMQTSNVAIDLKTRRVTGSGGVSGTIPAGTFTADRIIADLGERSVTLDGHARLHMAPGKLRMP
ncbi:MAG: LPS export ABC transporter periplasmic protein LptC [Sphingomonadales bacterium]|nr:LPS export ABC transporter periplasmic protein LptC [Sphingomonadales bacterium]